MKKLRPWLFTLAGMVTGFLYYRFFGCTNGCAITSSPYLTMAYMGLIGWLLSGIFAKTPGAQKE